MSRIAQLLCLALILSAVCAAGCGKKQRAAPPDVKTRYQFNVAGQHWRVKLTINHQPAYTVEGWSAIADVTHFVVDGKNMVRIEAERMQHGLPETFRKCDIRFVSMPAGASGPAQPKTIGGIYDDGSSNKARLEGTFEFKASVPARWTWQDADDIGQLTDADKQEILAVVSQVAAAYRRKDWKAVRSMPLGMWPGGQGTGLGPGPPDAEARAEKFFKKIFAHPDYTVEVAAAEDIRFAAGSKLVQISAGPDAIIHVGRPKSAGQGVSTGPSRMSFVKKGGVWHWMF